MPIESGGDGVEAICRAVVSEVVVSQSWYCVLRH